MLGILGLLFVRGLLLISYVFCISLIILWRDREFKSVGGLYIRFKLERISLPGLIVYGLQDEIVGDRDWLFLEHLETKQPENME